MKWVRLSRVPYLVSLCLLIGLAVVLLFLLPTLSDLLRQLGTVEHAEQNVLEVLSREQFSFLVTDRIVSQIVVESRDSNPLRRQFKSAALEYMRQENLIPGKQDILARLSTFGELLSERVGLDVVFQ